MPVTSPRITYNLKKGADRNEHLGLMFYLKYQQQFHNPAGIAEKALEVQQQLDRLIQNLHDLSSPDSPLHEENTSVNTGESMLTRLKTFFDGKTAKNEPEKEAQSDPNNDFLIRMQAYFGESNDSKMEEPIAKTPIPQASNPITACALQLQTVKKELEQLQETYAQQINAYQTLLDSVHIPELEGIPKKKIKKPEAQEKQEVDLRKRLEILQIKRLSEDGKETVIGLTMLLSAGILDMVEKEGSFSKAFEKASFEHSPLLQMGDFRWLKKAPFLQALVDGISFSSKKKLDEQKLVGTIFKFIKSELPELTTETTPLADVYRLTGFICSELQIYQKLEAYKDEGGKREWETYVSAMIGRCLKSLKKKGLYDAL